MTEAATSITSHCARLQSASESHARLQRTTAHAASLRHELQAMERVLLDGGALTAALCGRRIVYVGGRPGSNIALRALVGAAGGEFLHYVGLVDDDGAFAALLPGVHQVYCPLDVIDPDSLGCLRRLCAINQVPWAPLRSSGVASFIAGVLRVRALKGRVAAAPSMLCLRHG